ncbi:MAG: restriction endonuclease, SacI family [Bacteroidota bacterium]
MSPAEFEGRCRDIMAHAWEEILSKASEGPLPDFIEDESLCESVRSLVNGNTKSYRYVLPTQLVAKLADPSLDARCLQASRGGPGAFDARSICDAVTVPFDRQNHNVLGGSSEPYANNPLRYREITPQYRDQQKDKASWDMLCSLLQLVEDRQDPNFTAQLFRQILREVYSRLQAVQLVYPVPRRISLEQIQALLREYLSVKSGGSRVQVVVAAFMKTVGQKFRLFEDIRCESVNTADASSGQLADIECIDAEGKTVFLVEAKDRYITVKQIEDKLPAIRASGITDTLFVSHKGIEHSEVDRVRDLIRREFSAGQNIYVLSDAVDFMTSMLAFLREDGRRKFLTNVGEALDSQGLELADRLAWSKLLSSV